MNEAASKVNAEQLPEVVQELLKARGMHDPDEVAAFLNPNYDDLHDPFLMTGMAEGADRILQAIKDGQEIVVYGDYDIDGITASALLLEAIHRLGGKAVSYIPDRFEEGYGVNLKALQKLRLQGHELVVTVDCGITSVAEVAWAAANGLDIVITDHHSVPEVIPQAIAVINPKQLNDKYPFKELAGVGVAFKLVQALQTKTSESSQSDGLTKGQEKWLLDLVALGTVCDVVPLVGENRILVKYGLMVMNKARRPGIAALAQVGGVPSGGLNSYHLGFVLGPRMNAAGRLEHASKSLELMSCSDASIAMRLAEELNELNQQRKLDQAKVLTEANQMAAKYSEDPILVLADEAWSHGIVGIVASRLVETWRKPTLVMQILGETAKGSARSVGGLDIVDNLRKLEHHFIKLGGHYFAAGYTIATKNIDQMRLDLNELGRQQLKIESSADRLKEPDIRVPDLKQLDMAMWKLLQLMEPYGHGNPKPIFRTNLKIAGVRLVGKDKSHLRLAVQDQIGNQLEAMAFGAAEEHAKLKVGMSVQADFQVALNEYQGRSSLELLVTGMRYE
jgi:single-stranded-DNA-specific exonuclease